MRNNLVNFRLKDDREINRIVGSVFEGIAAAIREVATIGISASESERSLI